MDNIVASDLKKPAKPTAGKFLLLDVTKKGRYEKVIKDNKINFIIHFAAILSGRPEI